ncbi:MAG: MATE family efflux transporter [Clostridia bacterium]|nr:MATE family efflux transporter [Clostridia bacterium]
MQENKMGVMPISKLLISMSVPMMLSMLVQALYNIVDSIFVAKIGESALTAVSIAFPMQNLMIAVGSGTGVGINAVVSKALGEKRQDYANKAANNGIWLAGASFVGFSLLVLIFGKMFISSQTVNASNPQIAVYGLQYIRIIGIMSFGLFFQMTFERLLQSTGKTIYSMITQMIGAVINIILDPILIFGLFGFPRLEVAGAAIATITGQVIAACIGLLLNIKVNKELHISPVRYRPSWKIVKHIYSVGIPSIFMMSISSVMNFGMNKLLMGFSSTATAVFGAYYKLQSFIFMPIFGMNNGMIPIVAYNFGARKPGRIVKTVQLSVTYATGIMVIGCILFHVIPGTLLGMFNASGTMLEIGIPALKIISYSFLLAGFGIVSSSFFQAMGHGMLSLIVSVLRQLVVLLPAAFVLAKAGGLKAVWWSFPLAEVCAAVFSILFVRYVYQKEIKPLSTGQE